jgi:hypothetical protein
MASLTNHGSDCEEKEFLPDGAAAIMAHVVLRGTEGRRSSATSKTGPRDQGQHDAQAAKRFFKRLLTGLHYEPRVIVTDKLRSYGVAQRQLLPGVEHRQEPKSE